MDIRLRIITEPHEKGLSRYVKCKKKTGPSFWTGLFVCLAVYSCLTV